MSEEENRGCDNRREGLAELGILAKLDVMAIEGMAEFERKENERKEDGGEGKVGFSLRLLLLLTPFFILPHESKPGTRNWR